MSFPQARKSSFKVATSVFLYTDGVTEAISPDGALFGIDRALQVLRDNRRRSAGEIVDALYQAVIDFVDGRALKDDVTAILIRAA